MENEKNDKKNQQGGIVSTVHVIPVNDLQKHKEEKYDCPCHPKISHEGLDNKGELAVVVIHNSFDGREKRTY